MGAPAEQWAGKSKVVQAPSARLFIRSETVLHVLRQAQKAELGSALTGGKGNAVQNSQLLQSPSQLD